MAKTKTCERCSTQFECGPTATSAHCWCNELPHIMPVDATKGCLCPVCLKQEIEKRIAEHKTAHGQTH